MMKKTNIPNVSLKHNAGDRAEENFDFLLNGRISGKNSLGYDRGSDVEHDGVGYSVKSSHFTLAAAGLLKGDDMTAKLNFYFATVHSSKVAYISKDGNAYIMNMVEFREFLEVFGTLERESEKNGGGLKVRCKAESKKMIDWLEVRVEA